MHKERSLTRREVVYAVSACTHTMRYLRLHIVYTRGESASADDATRARAHELGLLEARVRARIPEGVDSRYE